MFKKCYRCGKYFLFFQINEYGRCKQCEEAAQDEKWRSEIKEQKALKNNRPDANAELKCSTPVTPTSNVQSSPEKRGLVLTYEDFLEDDEISKIKERFIAFDVETTGLSSAFDRIVEIGAVVFENSVPVKSFSTLVNPNVLIPQSATAINHITNEMISTAPPEKRAFSDLISFWGDVLDTRTILCAHNARFDMDFLSETLMRLGYDGKIKYIDTLRLSKNMIYGVENHKQQTLANYFGIVNSHEHRAASDAKVCGEILLKLINMKNEEAERKEREINNVKERIRLLQNEYQNMQVQLTINPINSRVPLQDIKSLNNQSKGFDKGIAYWEQGESLRKAESIEAAIKLFDEARYNGYCAPALYESYAMAYHKIKDLDNEIDILNEGIERLDDSIYVCEKLMIRRNKATHMLIKKLEQQRECQFKEMKRQEREAQKEQAANKPKKAQGRAILKLSDDMELIERYETVASAARENGISPKNIRDAANGVYKHAGGFVWRYADESNSENQGNE